MLCYVINLSVIVILESTELQPVCPISEPVWDCKFVSSKKQNCIVDFLYSVNIVIFIIIFIIASFTFYCIIHLSIYIYYIYQKKKRNVKSNKNIDLSIGAY